MSRELRTVFRHSGVYAAASLLGRAATFILLPVYTRFMPPADYGILGLVTVASEIVGVAMEMGLGTSMFRVYFDYTDEREQAGVVTTAIFSLAAMSALVTLPLWLAAEPLGRLLLGVPGSGDLLLLGMGGLVLNSLFTLGLHYFRMCQRSATFLVASTGRSLGFLAVNALLVAGFGMGVRGALLGTLLVNAFAAACVLVPIVVRLGPRFGRAKLRAMLGFGLPMLPGSLADFAMNFADRYLIVTFASLSAAGVYFLGFRLGNLLYATLIVPFVQIWGVRRLEAYGAGTPDPEASRLFTYFFLLTVSVALGLALVAPELIAVISSRDYQGAATIIPLVALNQVILSLLLITQLGIYYRKVSRHLTTVSVAALAVHVPVNALLIYAFGIVGAAAAGVVTATVKVALTTYLTRRLGGPRPEWRRLGAILAGAFVLFVVGRTITLTPAWTGLAARGVLIAAFPFALLRSTLFSVEERGALRSLVRWARAPRPSVAADR